MEIKRIVLTGGPCAGKSTALEWLVTEFEKDGYTVLTVSESPTELMNGGIRPLRLSNYEFERAILKLQLEKEEIYDRAAENLDAQKVLILYDRGLLDPKTYTTKEEVAAIVQELGINLDQRKKHYDGVFHLVTAAKGASDYYSLSSNPARRESDLADAIAADDSLLDVWRDHPHFRVIDNSTGFEAKLQRLADEIRILLGMKEKKSQQVDYELEPFSWQQLKQLPEFMEQETLITPLISESHQQRALVQVKSESPEQTFYLQVKDPGQTPGDYQMRISKNEYLKLLMDADTSQNQVRIEEGGFFWKDQYFQVSHTQNRWWLTSPLEHLQQQDLPSCLHLKKADGFSLPTAPGRS